MDADRCTSPGVFNREDRTSNDFLFSDDEEISSGKYHIQIRLQSIEFHYVVVLIVW